MCHSAECGVAVGELYNEPVGVGDDRIAAQDVDELNHEPSKVVDDGFDKRNAFVASSFRSVGFTKEIRGFKATAPETESNHRLEGGAGESTQ